MTVLQSCILCFVDIQSFEQSKQSRYLTLSCSKLLVLYTFHNVDVRCSKCHGQQVDYTNQKAAGFHLHPGPKRIQKYNIPEENYKNSFRIGIDYNVIHSIAIFYINRFVQTYLSTAMIVMVNVDMQTETPIAKGGNLHEMSFATYSAKNESITIFRRITVHSWSDFRFGTYYFGYRKESIKGNTIVQTTIY